MKYAWVEILEIDPNNLHYLAVNNKYNPTAEEKQNAAEKYKHKDPMEIRPQQKQKWRNDPLTVLGEGT